MNGESLTTKHAPLGEKGAVNILKIALITLLALVPLHEIFVSSRRGWDMFIRLRKTGRYYPNDNETTLNTARQVVELVDCFEDEFGLDLARTFVRVFASRNSLDNSTSRHEFPFRGRSDIVIQPPSYIRELTEFLVPPRQSIISYSEILLEWTRALFLKTWNGETRFPKSSDLSSILHFMSYLYERRHELGISTEQFIMPHISTYTDFISMPPEWHKLKPSDDFDHLLSYPWLFPPTSIVTFFRAINYSRMFKQHEASMTMSNMVARIASIAASGERQLYDRLKTAMAHFFVVEARREYILEDAMNQLWRRQERELLRPLKVKMGMEEGEEGVDHGGVQQEFFRIALGVALDPKYGMFTVDDRTKMAWFRPCSPEPLFRFTLVGLLVGLAVYNGITLPVTFPLALYVKLLGMRVKSLEDISDGWPDLSKGLRALLDWTDGDVEDIFMRSYIFDIETPGSKISIDMNAQSRDAPFDPTDESDLATVSQEAAMVTNENRERFVDDYIFWLTGKSVQLQYDAFASGFFSCITKRSLQLFTPSLLQRLVEGTQEIDIQGLRNTTTYENGYDEDKPIIRDFWAIVKTFSPEEVRHLLEFVTASDRIPMRGVEDIMFVIQRNGSGDERLPTSMTCFGRLLLPQYSSAEVLEVKLRLAIENSKGFGVA